MAMPILTAFLNLFGYNAHCQNPISHHQPKSAQISPNQPASADAERPPLANRLHDLARHLTLVDNTNAAVKLTRQQVNI